MIKLVILARGHYYAAFEHIDKYKLNHKPTWSQAIAHAINDLIKYNVIVDKTTGSYLVYNRINKYTIGIEIAELMSVYVPKEFRGMKIARKLKDRVKLVLVEQVVGDASEKYIKIASLCVTNRKD